MKYEKIYRYRMLILLALVAVSMGYVKWKYRNVNWEESTRLITPTVMPTSVPQINDKYPLWSLLPYTEKDFVVDRYVEPLVMAIKIKKEANEKLISEEVFEWMRENKIATESHKLIFEKE